MGRVLNSWLNLPWRVFANYFFSAFIFLICGISSAQDLTTTAVLGAERLEISLQPRDAGCLKIKQISIGAVFCFAMTIKTPNEAWLKELKVQRFDMIMPEHRHGMVTRARVKATKTGEYSIDGVKAHMPGEWKITIDLVQGKSAAQVAIPLKL
jgi:hypothetical protein